MTTPKRIGRPMKPVEEGRRYPLGLRVTAQIKRRIDEMARNSGRTQSQEAEDLLEKALQAERLLAAAGTSLPEVKQAHAEADFRARGYVAVHSPHGDIWFPPGYPGIERSGFIPQPPEDE
jgi:hypothetical protein